MIAAFALYPGLEHSPAPCHFVPVGAMFGTRNLGPINLGPLYFVPESEVTMSPSAHSGKNPFLVGVLATGEHFADREDEVDRMVRAFNDPGSRLVVYGDRRLGKSSAVQEAAQRVREDGGHVTTASLATATNSSEAAQRVLSAVHDEIGRSWREALSDIASGLNVGVELRPPTHPGDAPSIRLDLGLGSPSRESSILPDVLNAINEQMEKRGQHLGLALDEFQRIHDWGGEDAEWAFREAVQQHERLSYVLVGSKRGLITAMVNRKGRALWKIADTLFFGPIDFDEMSRWIVRQAEDTSTEIPEEVAALIVSLAYPRTRDVVQLARATWFIAQEQSRANLEDVQRAFAQIVQEEGELYRTIFLDLTAREQNILRALATEEVTHIMAADTLRRFQLGPKSSVQSAADRLVEEEHLTKDDSGPFCFDDPFFRRWVQVHALPDIGEFPPPLTAPQ